MNAKTELLEHVGNRPVKYVQLITGGLTFEGSLENVLPLLNIEYDEGYGGQELFGNIWYEDGSWSERGEYDGSEWWEHKKCPVLPDRWEDKR
jgi:hypothetical protein